MERREQEGKSGRSCSDDSDSQIEEQVDNEQLVTHRTSEDLTLLLPNSREVSSYENDSQADQGRPLKMDTSTRT